MSRNAKIILGILGVLLVCCIGAGIAMALGGTFLGRALEGAVATSPEEVSETGQSILTYTVPPGYAELTAVSMLGNTVVMIGPENDQDGMMIMLARFSASMAGNEEGMQQQLQEAFGQPNAQNLNFTEVATEDITINGEPSTLRITEATDENGAQIRQATTTFTTEEDLGMLLITGSDAEWDDQAVEAFLNSVQ